MLYDLTEADRLATNTTIRMAASEPLRLQRGADRAPSGGFDLDSTGERANGSARTKSGDRDEKTGATAKGKGRGQELPARVPPVYAALDLGTNNCRLLVARPAPRGFKVVDAFSRIVRLGEGLQSTGTLSKPAMARAVDALKVCTDKMIRRNVSRSRLIATEACRQALNGGDFIERARTETGLRLEVISRQTEAELAVAGSAALIDPGYETVIVFDIGGGSSELMWLSVNGGSHKTEAWMSLPTGVVTLAEKFGGVDVGRPVFEAMVAEVSPMLRRFDREHGISRHFPSKASHMLGTSGTVTAIAGVHLGLSRYKRSKVDGCWLETGDISRVTNELLRMTFDERAASPCIGRERADLVLAGCAILEAIRHIWPCDRVRVADRGLREGILTGLMMEDGVFATACPGSERNGQPHGHAKPRRHRRRRRKSGNADGNE